MGVAKRLPTIFRGMAQENWMDGRCASIGMDRGMRFYTCGTPMRSNIRKTIHSLFDALITGRKYVAMLPEQQLVRFRVLAWHPNVG